MSGFLTTTETVMPHDYSQGPLPTDVLPGTIMYDFSSRSFRVFSEGGWCYFDLPSARLTPSADAALQFAQRLSWEYPLSEAARDQLVDAAARFPLIQEALGQLAVAIALCQDPA